MANKEICCELIDGKKWQRKTVQWKSKPFVKDSYFALFYMPQGVERKITKWVDRLKSRKLLPKDGMILWRNEGLFGGEILITTKKAAPDLPIEEISGKFFTMCFEGKSYSEAGKWYKSFQDEAIKKGMKVKEIMMWYTVCPACMKKFGKVQGVLFGRI